MAELTEKDVVKILTLIRINFPNAYGLAAAELKILTRQWYSSLRKYPREIVLESVNRVLEQAEFAPHLGNLVNEIKKVTRAVGKSATEMWHELAGTLREVFECYHSLAYSDGEKYLQRLKAIYAGLPEEVRQFCGSVYGLAKLGDMTEEQLSYERGRFLREADTIRERIEIRTSVSERLKIGEGSEGGTE